MNKKELDRLKEFTGTYCYNNKSFKKLLQQSDLKCIYIQLSETNDYILKGGDKILYQIDAVFSKNENKKYAHVKLEEINQDVLKLVLDKILDNVIVSFDK